MNRTRSRLAAGLVSLTLAGAGLVAASPAEAASVTGHVDPYFYCSNQTGRCQQINGTSGPIGRVKCHWVFSTYWRGPLARSICDYWV